MFKEFYTEMIVPVTQLTGAELYQFLMNIGLCVVVLSVFFTLISLLMFECKNIVKAIFASLFIAVLFIFNFFWTMCFLNDRWKGYFWLDVGAALIVMYVLIRAGVRFYKNNKERKSKDDNI